MSLNSILELFSLSLLIASWETWCEHFSDRMIHVTHDALLCYSPQRPQGHVVGVLTSMKLKNKIDLSSFLGCLWRMLHDGKVVLRNGKSGQMDFISSLWKWSQTFCAGHPRVSCSPKPYWIVKHSCQTYPNSSCLYPLGSCHCFLTDLKLPHKFIGIVSIMCVSPDLMILWEGINFLW